MVLLVVIVLIYLTYITRRGGGLLLTRIASISGMRDSLSAVFVRLGSLLKKKITNSPPAPMIPAKRPRDHSPVPHPAPANSKRFRNATVLAPMVRSGNCESFSTSPEYLQFQYPKLLLSASFSILQAKFFRHIHGPNLPFQVSLIDLQCPPDSYRCNTAPRSYGALK